MKTLIINADDYGSDPARTRGILEAVDAGVVTSVSLLANGPAFFEALAGVQGDRRRHLSVGLHLNLSEGSPLAENLSLIPGDRGLFRGKTDALALFEKSPSPKLKEELHREITAQAQRLLDAGLTITHLDGHQHVHLFPAVIDSVLEAAEKFSIPWIRLPDEEPRFPAGKSPLDTEAGRFRDHAVRVRRRITAAGFRRTDHFRGLFLKGRVTLDSLLDTLDQLPEGTTELMVHPGRATLSMSSGAFGSFATKDREDELEALLSDRFRQRLEERNIRLISFNDLREQANR